MSATTKHVAVPDASTVSRTRRRLPGDVFDEVFRLVLGIVDSKGLLKGRVRGVDSTYLKADASMRSIVRKDTGEDYRTYSKRVAAEAEAEATVERPPESTKPRDDHDSSGGACDTSSEGEAAIKERNWSIERYHHEEDDFSSVSRNLMIFVNHLSSRLLKNSVFQQPAKPLCGSSTA
jgi:hypothetical protein